MEDTKFGGGEAGAMPVKYMVNAFKAGEGDLEHFNEQHKKSDAELEMGLDFLAAKDWKGHLITICHMEGRPKEERDDFSNFGESDIGESHVVAEGSVVAKRSDASEGGEGTESSSLGDE